MAEERLPTPDPTPLTNEAVERAINAIRDYTDGQLDVLRERLRGIDTATEVLNTTVTRVPTETQKEVAHLKSLMDERFQSVQTQFAERDTRQERESRDNKIAVDAAFAAQKEIAAKQDESNAKAIEKSEKATEKIIDAQSGKIDDLKERLTAVEAIKRGGQQAYAGIYAALGVATAIIGIFLFVTRKGT
jgi:O6-methylguanine-DNA--protein-cysteine methyltransferase